MGGRILNVSKPWHPKIGVPHAGIRAACIAIVMVCAAFLPTVAQKNGNSAFRFGLIGDTPYTLAQEAEFDRVVAALNADDLAFVIHVGDTQSSPGDYYENPSAGSLPCTDERYQAVYLSIQRIRHPFVLTPGDNDWTDCHLVKSPRFDPLDRLAKVRGMFYPEGHTLGQRTIQIESQASVHPQFAKFRENQRWSVSGVTFGTLHIVGSNDNFGRHPEMDTEHFERKAANIAWLRSMFSAAKESGSLGLVLMTHANIGFENYWPPEPKARYFRPFVRRGGAIPAYRTAFDDYASTLRDELENYRKPVAFLHGDTHLFRIDKPMYSQITGRLFDNFTRVETFGNPDSHWVRVTVDPMEKELFHFEPQIVSKSAASDQ